MKKTNRFDRLRTASLRMCLADLAIILGLFIILFIPPIFSFRGIHLNAAHVVGVSSIVYLLWRLRVLKFLKVRENIWLVGGFLVLLGYGIVLYLVHRTGLSSMSSQLYYLVDVIPFAFVVADYGNRKGLEVLDYIKLAIFVGMIHAVIALAMMVIPGMQAGFINMLLDYGYSQTVAGLTYRLYGFSGQLTFAAPVMQSFLAVISFYLCFTQSKKYYIPCLVLLFTAIINARTTIIAFGIGAIIVLCCSKQWGWKHTVVTLKPLLLCLPVALIGIAVLWLVTPYTVQWIFAGFKEIFSFLGGSDKKSTFTALLSPEHLSLPPVKALLFGVGSQIMGGYENVAAGLGPVHSDVGYINDIWYGGIVYAIFQYAFFYYIFSRLMKKENAAVLRFFGLFLMIIIPVLNMKGIACSMNAFTNLVLILVIAVINMPGAKRKVNENG